LIDMKLLKNHAKKVIDLITISDVQINWQNAALKHICTFLAKAVSSHGCAEFFEKLQNVLITLNSHLPRT